MVAASEVKSAAESAVERACTLLSGLLDDCQFSLIENKNRREKDQIQIAHSVDRCEQTLHYYFDLNRLDATLFLILQTNACLMFRPGPASLLPLFDSERLREGEGSLVSQSMTTLDLSSTNFHLSEIGESDVKKPGSVQKGWVARRSERSRNIPGS